MSTPTLGRRRRRWLLLFVVALGCSFVRTVDAPVSAAAVPDHARILLAYPGSSDSQAFVVDHDRLVARLVGGEYAVLDVEAGPSEVTLYGVDRANVERLTGDLEAGRTYRIGIVPGTESRTYLFISNPGVHMTLRMSDLYLLPIEIGDIAWSDHAEALPHMRRVELNPSRAYQHAPTVRRLARRAARSRNQPRVVRVRREHGG